MDRKFDGSEEMIKREPQNYNVINNNNKMFYKYEFLHISKRCQRFVKAN